MDTVAFRVLARYKSKRKIKTQDGEMTVYEYSDRQIAHRHREKAKRYEKLKGRIGALRAKVKRDLKAKDPKKRLTALAVALLDHTFERVGNEESAKDGHVGVTGWAKKHISFGKKVTIKYVGKSGVKHTKEVTDASLKKALRDAYDAVDGDNACLFEDGDCKVSATDVNAYLKDFEVTAKDLRGFHANAIMQEQLAKARKGKLSEDKKEREKQLKDEFKTALEETAEIIGHEVATLRAQYLVPGLEAAYVKDGTVLSKLGSTEHGLSERSPLQRRIVARYLWGSNHMDIRTLKITADNLGDVINGLLAGVEDLEGHEARLKLDLRNMVALMAKYPHNDDAYHNGETVLVHVGWVLEDVERLSAGMDEERRVVLRLAALFHDLGKAYTYAYDPARKKHTFYDHGTQSVEIAKVLLAKHQEALGGLYQRVLDLTRLHDVFFALAAERPKGGNSTAYVKRLMDEALYMEGHLEDLLVFAKADSARARSYQEKLSSIEAILDDVKKHESILAAKNAERARIEANAKARMPEIRALLEVEFPPAASAPDVKGIRTELGKAKRYDLIEQVNAIINRS